MRKQWFRQNAPFKKKAALEIQSRKYPRNTRGICIPSASGVGHSPAGPSTASGRLAILRTREEAAKTDL